MSDSYHTSNVYKIPDYDKARRAHYWVAPVAFHIANPKQAVSSGDPVHMDQENLVFFGPITCYYCEETWTRYLHDRKCPGNPTEER